MTKLYKPRPATRALLRLRACASLLALASASNAQVLPGSPVLLTEGTGTTTRAVAYEAATFRSEPFAVVSPYNWNADKNNRDRQTRVMVFAMNLSLLAGSAAGVGSDHGWGNIYLVMGGSVRGGDFYGTPPTLALGGPDDADERGRWIPTTSLEQYAATLAAWYGVSNTDLPAVFPLINRFSTPNLGFMM